MLTLLNAVHWFAVGFGGVMNLAGCAAAVCAAWLAVRHGRDALVWILVCAGFAVLTLGGLLGRTGTLGLAVPPPWPSVVDLLGYALIAASIFAWPKMPRSESPTRRAYLPADPFMMKAGIGATGFGILVAAVSVRFFTLSLPPRIDALEWRLQLVPMVLISAMLIVMGMRLLRLGRGG